MSTLNCSFCKKSNLFVKKLIAGYGAYICDDCINLSQQICLEAGITPNNKISEKSGEKSTNSRTHFTPQVIFDKLSEAVIGQERAKKVLSLAGYSHLNRMKGNTAYKKSNILLAGPTGCGKTFIVQNLAKVLDVPYVIADATKFSSTGYVGRDVEEIILDLISAAGDDKSKAELGIIFVDEVDKIKKSTHQDGAKDVNGESVQQALLKLIEGGIHRINDGDKARSKMIDFDTSNILWVFSGAFVGLNELNTQSLVNFGMIPEFVGRMHMYTKLNELTKEELFNIAKNQSVNRYTDFFKAEKVKFSIADDVLVEVVTLALERKTGARGISSILEERLVDDMFSLASMSKKPKKLVINKLAA